MNYKGRLFLYFCIIFAFFTTTVLIFERWREEKYRVDMLSSSLLSYSYIAQETPESSRIPSDMRITLIEHGGKVVYDNDVNDEDTMESHFDRPEVINAKERGTGYDIRVSKTTGKQYFYYARRTLEGYVRVAMPYDANTEALLTADRSFEIFVFSLFGLTLIFLWFVARRFGQDIESLKRKVIVESESKNKLKSEMTSAIAHELRTPVAAIRGYAETLCSDGGIDQKFQLQFSKRILSASIRLSAMLENVSLLTKMEEAPDRFDFQACNISEIVEEIVEEFSGDLETKSVKLSNFLPKNLEIVGNETLLYSVWRNLIENSMKYGGSWITIDLALEEEDSDYYYFMIKDSGPGVEAKHLPRLFERFYRVDSGRTRDVGGSGLGLSIVAHAVATHKGRIYGCNGDNGGLEVHFSISKHL